MTEAIQLARKGLYTTAPNPRVGCVLVKNDTVVGRGFHRVAGDGHAEVNAIADAGTQANGATAYVSLEPCSFSGRTGACVDALLKAGIVRVISAMEDPNPRVAGSGNRLLQEAGVAVGVGLLASEANKLNLGYIQRMRVGKPWVRCKMAMSLDGRTAMASGESQWITSPASRQMVQKMRAQSCVLVTGIGTVLNDDPSLTVRSVDFGQVVTRQPAVVVVDSTLKIPLTARLLSPITETGSANALTRRVYIACGAAADQEKKAQLIAMGIEVLSLPTNARDDQRNGAVSLSGLLHELAQQQFNEIMIEAGPTLAGEFLSQGLVDQLDLFVAGKLLGSTAKPLFELPLSQMSEAKNIAISNIQAVGDDWLMTCVPDNSSTP